MKEIYSIENLKKIRWGVLEENKPISLYPVMYPGWCGIIKDTGKILGRPQKNIINLNRGDNGIIFVDHKEWTRLGEYALKKIVKDPAWGARLNKKILRLSDDLVRFTTKQIFKADLKKLNNERLVSLYKGYLKKHSDLYNHAIVPVYLDLYKPHLTTYLTEYLHRQVRKVGYPRSAKECFALLTVPKDLSKVQGEEKALLTLAVGLGKNKKKLKQRLAEHARKFKYLGYNFEGPAFPDSYFLKRYKKIILDKVRPELKLKAINAEKSRVVLNQEKLIKDLRIDGKSKKLLEITKGFLFSKDYRKMSLVESYFKVEPFLKELGSRLGLSLKEMRNCLFSEVEVMANGGARPQDLTRRMQGCLFAVVDQNLPGRVFIDQRFRTMRHHLLAKEDLAEVNYFHGQPACLGKARGKVKLINSVKELAKMKKGDILVTQMTNPDLVPAMKIAGAIVTDLGGITSHAAIVSRELNVPCVIGTKIATKVLKDGDLVEVDANSGDIRKI